MKKRVSELKLFFQFRHFSCVCVFSLLFVCCNSDQNASFDVEKSIKKTVRRFAYYKDLPSADLYKPVRTVIMEKQGIRLYLHHAEFPKYFTHYIVTIVNSQNQGYSIPMFSNEILNYWNFEFQDKDPTMPDCHTTFEKEFLTGMESLHLNDTTHTDYKVLCEIMLSLIDCQRFEKSDSLLFSRMYDYSYGDAKCRAVLRKIPNAIVQDVASYRSCFGRGVFWRHEARIYQVDLGGEKADISIKVYKLGCNS